MGKMIIVPAVFAFGLLASLLVGVQTVKASITSDGRGCPLLGNINITSPSNITYSSNMLTLNVTVQSLFRPSQYRFAMVYSIDGENNVTIPLTTTFMPINATVTFENGTTATVISIFSPYVTAGCVALPELPEGPHKLNVYANYERTSTNPTFPEFIWDSSTVYFTVDDGQPPVISALSLENKTYSQNALALNFTTNQPTSWIGYCLDGKTNVTIAGNTTLTGLSDGSHSVIVYANDTAGNMGISKPVVFTVDTPEPFPTTLVATASGASVAVVGSSLLVYFKKRRHQAGSH
jgi:hypothetical protein